MGLADRLHWHILALAILLILSADYLNGYFLQRRGSDGPLPPPGKAIMLAIVNEKPLNLSRDPFELTADMAVDPIKTLIVERPALPCRFRVDVMDGNARVARHEFKELSFSGEATAWHIASYSSELFAVPPGESLAWVTNLGCSPDYAFTGGRVSIGAVGEHLLIPLAAMLFRFIGVVLAGFELTWGIFRFFRSKMRA